MSRKFYGELSFFTTSSIFIDTGGNCINSRAFFPEDRRKMKRIRKENSPPINPVPKDPGGIPADRRKGIGARGHKGRKIRPTSRKRGKTTVRRKRVLFSRQENRIF